jgi:hypothetical protein
MNETMQYGGNMEDVRTYRVDEETNQRRVEEERREFDAKSEDEVPFHIPRD